MTGNNNIERRQSRTDFYARSETITRWPSVWKATGCWAMCPISNLRSLSWC